MSEYVTMLLEVVISVAIVLIVRYAIPYFKTLLDNEEYAKISEIVTVAVRAAEQTIRDSGQGKVKKAQVVAFVSAWLVENNIHISEDTLDKLIECAVKTLNMEMGK